MLLLSSARLLFDAAVLHAGLDEKTGWWFCFWQHQHRIYQTTHATGPGEELEGLKFVTDGQSSGQAYM